MSSETDARYLSALLADSAYVNDLPFGAGSTEQQLVDALATRLTRPLAQYVAFRVQVLHQYTESNVALGQTGFSATVFQDRESGQVYFVPRGTEAVFYKDLAVDADLIVRGLAVSQVVRMVNYWLRLTTPVSQLAAQLSEVALGPPLPSFGVVAPALPHEGYASTENQLSPLLTPMLQVVAAGHSLGGHLATAFARIFGDQVAHSYTYNSAGFHALSDLWFRNILSVLGRPDYGYPLREEQDNLFAQNGRDLTTNSWSFSQFGERTPVFNEEGTGIPNHLIYKLTDSLALYHVLSELDGNLSFEDITLILNTATWRPESSLESTLDSVRRAFGITGPDTPTGDTSEATLERTRYHANILELRSVITAQGVRPVLVPLGVLTPQELESRASLGIGYRYALRELHAFALTGTGMPYDAPNASVQLDVFDPTTGSGALTEEWIRDRAGMLYWYLVRNRDDIGGIVPNPGDEALQLVDRSVVDDKVVEERIRVGVSSSQPRTLAFGSERADDWRGSGYADGLYGGAGDDRLAGLAGDDYLQGDAGTDFLHGGAGNDTLVGGKDTDVLIGGAGVDIYRWRRGDGSDYLIDFTGDGFGGDGEGTIEFLGTTLAGSLALTNRSASERIYTGPNGLTYTLTGAHSGRGILTISKPDEPGGVSVLGFRTGDLGLMLDAPEPIEISQQAGSSGPDTLWSHIEHEQVLGYESNDRIALSHLQTEGHGDAGHDYLTDGASDQKLYGEAGRDILIASAGSDELYGGEDADALQGGAGDDYLTAGSGDDVADGGPGADVIEGGDGDDFLLGGGSLVPGIDWSPAGELAAFGALVVPGQIAGIQGMAGEINVEGDEADLIDAGAGNDTVLAGDGDDLVLGGLGIDYLVGQAGNDALNGEDGDDVLLGDGSEGALAIGGQRYFTLPIAHGDDLLAGGEGNDRLEGDGGADQLYGNEGDDSLDGDSGWLDAIYHGDDYLDGGEGNDWLTGNGGSDTLYGGAGDDWMQGDSSLVPSVLRGNDLLFGGDGDDQMVGDGGVDQLFGEAGDDSLFGDADDNDVAYDGADVLDGGEGNDYLRGHGGDDLLVGGSGNDILLGDGGGSRAGETGNDTLVGGPGFDRMDGGRGDDRYELNVGDGVDKIFDASGTNTVVFGQGISASAITVQQGQDESGTYAVIGYGAGDVLAVENGFTGGIQFYRFADGTVLTPAELVRRLERTQYASVLGSADDDALASTSFLEVLDGGAGSDVYVFGATSGQDIVVEGGGFVDTVRFDASVVTSQVTYARASNGDLVVTVAGGSEVRIGGHYLAPERRVETIEFADGTTLSTELLDALPIVPIVGSAGDDWLAGSDFADTLEGGPGRDTLVGGRGADTYVFHAGDGEETIIDGDGGGGSGDRLQLRGFSKNNLWFERTIEGTLTIHGLGPGDSITLPDFYSDANRIETIEIFVDPATELPDDSIQLWELSRLATVPVFGTDADDTITGSDAADTLLGEAGNDVISALEGDDALFGSTGDDTLIGGPGADTLNGEDGCDLLYGDGGDDSLDGGAGDDVLRGGEGGDTLFGGAGADQFTGGPGRDHFADVRLSDGDAILDVERNEVVTLTDVADFSTLTAANVSQNGAAGVLIRAAAATTGVFLRGELIQLDALDPTLALGNGNRVSYAALMDQVFTADVTLVGTPIGDLLKGYAGSDTLQGLAGDDRLLGGAGEDVLEGDEGNDVLVGGTGVDILRGGAGNDTYTIDAADFVCEFAGEGFDTVVADFSAILGPNLEAMNLVGSAALDATGNVLANVLVGNDAANMLFGLEGDDTLLGNGGSDTLVGGPGDDFLVGGAGDDEYLLSVGDGSDTIEDRAGMNVVTFGAGITASNLVADTYVGDDGTTYLSVAYGDGDVLAIRGGLLGSVSEYRFADGAVLTHRDFVGTLGPLSSDGSPVDDTTTGASGADALAGGDGDDVLHGGGADDVLRGDAGRDRLYGEAGDDTLEGGGGNDVLIGGAGEDTYILAWGTGADRIEEEGLDASHLRLGPAIGFDDLMATSEGNDLTLALRGNADSAITIAGYFASGANWDVTSASGETRSLADVLSSSPSAPADPIAAAIAAFEVRVKAAYFTSLGAIGFESDGADKFQSASTVFLAHGTNTTYSSYAVRVVQQASDAQLIQRLTLPFEADTRSEWSESELHVVSTKPGSRGVAKVLADFGWRFVPASEFAPAVTMSTTGIGVSKGAADYSSAQASSLQGFWVPTSGSAATALATLPEPVQSVVRITNSVTYETASLNIEEIYGGAESNAIWTSDYSIVDGGAGSDFIAVYDSSGYELADTRLGYGRLGSLLYGNEGDDSIAGGADNDILIGGLGDDVLAGGAGADIYGRVGEGSDSIADTGEDFDRYRQAYFNTSNFSDLEVRERGGGRYLDRVALAEFGLYIHEVRLLFDSPLEGLEWALRPLRNVLEYQREVYAALLAWDTTGAPPTSSGQTAHDVRREIERYEAEIAWEESHYLDRFVYVEPLPPLPIIAGNDYTAIEPYYGSAVWIDRVELTEQWRPDTLMVSTAQVDGEPVDLYLDHRDGTRVTIALPRAADPIGTGIEIVAFADGTELTIRQVLALESAPRYVVGSNGDDVLRGGTSPDTLIGGLGDDTYYVGAGDLVTERLGQGVDTVVAGQSWSLGKHVENLTLTGTGDFSGTGNNLPNVLIGNDGDNWIDGKGGADTMAGGRGDDTYVVAQGADIVIENIDEGIDTVIASVAFTLDDDIENLTLTGERAINGTGNGLANVLTGNAANNKLAGGEGDDYLDGQAGTDTLVGGLGDDTYVLGPGYGADTIVENDSTFGNTDRAVFLGGIESDQIWFRRVDDDLEASIIGTTDAFVLRDWYRNAARRVERFETSNDDETLLQANVQTLVDAMAAFAPPTAGITTLPLDYQTVLSPLIAANWQ